MRNFKMTDSWPVPICIYTFLAVIIASSQTKIYLLAPFFIFIILLTIFIKKKDYTIMLVVLFYVFLYAVVPFFDTSADIQISQSSTIAVSISIPFLLLGILSNRNRQFSGTFTIEQEKTLEDTVFKFSKILVIIGVLSFFIYSQIYGGLFNLITSSANIRQGQSADSNLLFFSRFIALNTIGSYLLMGLVASKYKSKQLKLFTLISIILSLLNSFTTASRQILIMNLIIYAFIATPNLHKLRKIFSIRNILVLFVSIMFILYGKDIFRTISYGNDLKFGSSGGFSELISNFAHPIISLETSLTSVFSLRGINDFVIGFLNLLPKRLLGITLPDSVSFVNTKLVFGSELGFYPPGILGYFVYSFGYIGLIIGPFAYGYFSSKILKYLGNARRLSKVFSGIFLYGIISICQIMMSGDPSVFMKSYFVQFLTIFILFKFILRKVLPA